MRKNSGGSWCQCACREVPGCSTGASVKADASNWETGECGSHRSLTMASSLSSPPPAPQTSPSQYLLFFSWFLSLKSLFCSSPAGLSVLCLLFLFWFYIFSPCSSWPNKLPSCDCAVFMYHREKFSNHHAKTFLFTISPKDLWDVWEGTDDSSDSMVKKETFFDSGIWHKLLSQYTCAKTKFFASVESLWSSYLISCGLL